MDTRLNDVATGSGPGGVDTGGTGVVAPSVVAAEGEGAGAVTVRVTVSSARCEEDAVAGVVRSPGPCTRPAQAPAATTAATAAAAAYGSHGRRAGRRASRTMSSQCSRPAGRSR